MAETIHVVAGVLRDESGRVLIAQRLSGTHMAGRWEFPGGKLQPTEQQRAGLLRELREELGITVTACSPLIRLRHSYPERQVLLDTWSVHNYDGEPAGVEGQALRWLSVSELHHADLLEADKPIVDALRLPDRYAITPENLPDSIESWVKQIDAVAGGAVCLIQLRAPRLDSTRLHELTIAAIQAARGAAIVINGNPEVTIPMALATGAAGVHVPSRFLPQLSTVRAGTGSLPPEFLIGASCHDAGQLELAARKGASFAVLGPVLPTATHPDAAVLGWDRFGDMVDAANLPVYALGGVGPDSIGRARALGAQGIAGIRAFFGG